MPHESDPEDARRERLEAIVGDALEPLRRFLARRADAATADDVLADTLLVCWRRLDDVPEPALPWLYGVARGCLANAQRSARRQHRVAAKIAVVDPPEEAAPFGSPSETGDGTGDETGDGTGGDTGAEAVRSALTRLPERDAELLRLWAWEQLGTGEIALVLGVTPNAASIRLHRAREKLRVELRKTRPGAGHEQPGGGRRAP